MNPLSGNSCQGAMCPLNVHEITPVERLECTRSRFAAQRLKNLTHNTILIIIFAQI